MFFCILICTIIPVIVSSGDSMTASRTVDSKEARVLTVIMENNYSVSKYVDSASELTKAHYRATAGQ
jgi:hypothetical protein